jgi:hypothetical protein
MAAISTSAWPLTGGHQPRIYIVTLGTFEVYVDQQPAIWAGGAAGARQLQRAVGYLIAHRGQFVRKAVLIDVVGGRSMHGARYVITGVQRLLRSWGMELALTLQKAAISLRQDETWGTDTDMLEALFADAEALQDAGQAKAAIQILRDAATRCGGTYLPILDTIPDYIPHGDIAYWLMFQKKVLHGLVRLCLAAPEAVYHEQALRVVGQAIELDRFDPESYMLAARAARQCGNEASARSFDQIARTLRSDKREC